MKKMILEIHEAGFFSNFNKVVNHLRYSVETSAVSSFEVDWKMPDKNIPRYYADLCGDDLWSEFFEPMLVDGPFDTEERVSSYANYNMTSIGAYFHLYTKGDSWRREYHRVFKKYIKLKPHIADQVASFYSRYMAGKHCVGVHVRNHTISGENPGPIPAVDRFIEIAQQNLLPDQENVVYLATDVESTIQPFKSAFGDALLYREGVTRSQDHGKEIHSDSRIPANNLAKDVLLDCLLLAKADKFIHVTSNIATAVAYINPDLELIYARYDKDDPRALEAVLENNDDLEVTQFGEDRFELCLGSATNKREVNGFTVLVLRLCNGTRTQTELVNLLREWARNKPISNADIRGLATIRKLLRQGFIKRGELKCPIW